MMLFTTACRDLRFGARHLFKHPNYSVPMLLTLALTIAASGGRGAARFGDFIRHVAAGPGR